MTETQKFEPHLRAVILNDTAHRQHHGCSRVMRLLVAGLQRQRIEIIARSAVHSNWQSNPAFLANLPLADVIVINGEGTLHHGRPAAETLLKIATHPARGEIPIALVNALYQENPASWAVYLNEIAMISARDHASALEISSATGRKVGWLPDLSLSHPAEVAAEVRHGVLVGDSVKMSVRRVLARWANQMPEARFVPTKTLTCYLWRMPFVGPILRRILYVFYNMSWPRLDMQFFLPQTEAAYLDQIAGAKSHVTGRFHAICLSMLTETPFLAVASNSHKIEQLLMDAGVKPSRVVTAATLPTSPVIPEFDEAELAGLRAFRTHAQTAAEQLYKSIALLAQEHVAHKASRANQQD